MFYEGILLICVFIRLIVIIYVLLNDKTTHNYEKNTSSIYLID